MFELILLEAGFLDVSVGIMYDFRLIHFPSKRGYRLLNS